MNVDTRIKTILSMKSLPVLLMMFWLDRPTGEADIVEYCSIDRKTARKYLTDLAKDGFITRTGRFNSWMLSGGGRQMLLEVNGTRGNISPTKGNIYPMKGKFFPTTTTTETHILINSIVEEKEDSHIEGYILPNEGENLPNEGEILPLNINNIKIDPDLEDALKECGIYGSVREELACREDLTPEIIRNLCEKLKAEKKGRYSTGLLVHCLRELDEEEVEQSKEEDYRKYVKGKYAEYIQH